MRRRTRIGLGLASLLLVAAPAPAGELGTGPLGRDRYRQPGETLRQVERARRALPRDTSIDDARYRWELDEIERDARRALRQRRAAPTDRKRPGLLDAGRRELPDERDVRGADRVYGTAKAWVRVGDLLGRAEERLRLGDSTGARALAAAARTEAEAATDGAGRRSWRGDAQVRTTLGRLGALERALGR